MKSALDYIIIEELAKQPHERVATLTYTVGLRIGFIVPRAELEKVIDGLMADGTLVYTGRWIKPSRRYESEFHVIKES